MRRNQDILRDELAERLVAVLNRSKASRLFTWLVDVRIAEDDEHKRGVSVVVGTVNRDVEVRIAVSDEDMRWFNKEYPANGIAIVILYSDYRDDRLIEKTLHFVDRVRNRRK